jgi:hypothetical protein
MAVGEKVPDKFIWLIDASRSSQRSATSSPTLSTLGHRRAVICGSVAYIIAVRLLPPCHRRRGGPVLMRDARGLA